MKKLAQPGEMKETERFVCIRLINMKFPSIAVIQRYVNIGQDKKFVILNCKNTCTRKNPCGLSKTRSPSLLRPPCAS